MLVNGNYENIGNAEVQVALADCLSIVDKYLWGHPDLLEKRLILITTTAEAEQWVGFVLINPWVRLVKEAQASNKQNDLGNMKKKKFDLDTCLSGMICNTSYAFAESPATDIS
jgi:hypothetical protein